MSDERQKRFYPDYLSEIVLVMFFFFFFVVVLALLFPQKMGRLINFTAPYQPKPEWYFLWLYQLVRYFHGPWIFVGTVLIPLLTVAFIIYIPWIDRDGRGRNLVLFGTFFILAFFLLFTIIPAFN